MPAIKWFVATFLAVLIAVVVFVHYSSPFKENLSFPSVQNKIVIWTAFGTALSFSAILLASGRLERCQECKRWWARTFLGKEEVTRKFEHHIPSQAPLSNVRLRLSGFSDRPRHLVIDLYKNHYKCKYCSYEWTVMSTSEYSG